MRLELTWPNKGRRLLAHGSSTYEWVDPDDWRVTEVRQLDEVSVVGDPDPANLLIEGDALHALSALIHLPRYSKRYLGKVKLCYLDPPFNTQMTFEHYSDALEHSVWLTMMRDRLVQIRRLLSDDGSIWIHLDDSEQHRTRSVLDEVFGAENFIATCVWQKADSTRNDAKRLSIDHDYLIGYAKSPAWRVNRLPRTSDSDARFSSPDGDERPWLRFDNSGQTLEAHLSRRKPTRRCIPSSHP